MDVRIITKHMGNPGNLEFAYHIAYERVSKHGYVKRFGVIPVQPHFCIVDGGFRYCDSCKGFTDDSCVDQLEVSPNIVEKIVVELVTKGYPHVEDRGEIIIDATGHEPARCASHLINGCIICYGCAEEHGEE